MFCDLIGKEKAKKCALIMHTEAVNEHGTDLRAVKVALTDPEYCNILFSQEKLNTPQMNMMYNAADVTILLSSNEGWGLSLTESMMAGTMIIANTTGGMQDQMRFTDEEGKWIDFNADFPSNHRATYMECGEWAVPVFPSNISLAGSPKTPYIFDDKCTPEEAAEALLEVYELGPEERKRRGLKGREWVTSDESGMSARVMCENVIQGMEEAFSKFKPRTKYDVIKVEDKQVERVPHKLTGY
jgi:glycogen synthase